jgi:hypothetical protein
MPEAVEKRVMRRERRGVFPGCEGRDAGLIDWRAVCARRSGPDRRHQRYYPVLGSNRHQNGGIASRILA